MTEFRATFITPYSQHADRQGQPFKVLATIIEADDTHDPEVLPMYRIQFPDGFITDAWPEEMDAAYRPAVQISGGSA